MYMYQHLYSNNLAKSKCYAVQNTFLSYVSAALPNNTISSTTSLLKCLLLLQTVLQTNCATANSRRGGVVTNNQSLDVDIYVDAKILYFKYGTSHIIATVQ